MDISFSMFLIMIKMCPLKYFYFYFKFNGFGSLYFIKLKMTKLIFIQIIIELKIIIRNSVINFLNSNYNEISYYLFLVFISSRNQKRPSC
jgi:hypothetical protein